MATLKILIPDDTVNYIKNPSFRYDATDWNAVGSTLTRTLEEARFGVAGGKVVTNGAAFYEGVFFRVSSLGGISDNITVSIYVRGSGSVRIRLDDNAPGGSEYVSQPVSLLATRWKRISVTGRSHGGDDLRLYVETDEKTISARTFYIDGAQLERKPYITTYCDGDQDGCRWDGVYHASASRRAGNTRAGGRWIELSGPQRESEDLYMTVAGGLGFAPITNNLQPYALQAGAFHQGVKVQPRLVTLTFHAKHKTYLRDRPVSLERLHELRQMLIDVVKPDRTAGDEAMLFEYADGDKAMYFWGRYDGGLEGDWDVRNGWVNSFPVRLLAVEPFLEEDNQETQVLDVQDTIKTNYIAGRVNGRWQDMNDGFDNYPNAIHVGARGRVYAAGTFAVVNDDAAAVDPQIAGVVAYYDGEKWVPIATSIAGGASDIFCITSAPNGDVYVGGDFTSINGVAANRIARWNGSAWSALGTGLNDVCQDLAVHSNGNLYAGGNFTTAGGVSCYRVAYWDGLQWRRLGDYGGMDSGVYGLDFNDDFSTLYIAGDFRYEQGTSSPDYHFVAQYNLSTGKFATMGSGFTAVGGGATMWDILVSATGLVYACGRVVDPNGKNAIAYFSGGEWVSMGEGLGESSKADEVLELAAFPDGSILAVGNFTKSGAETLRYITIWNGSTWLNLDIKPAGGITSCQVDQRTGDLYIGSASTLGPDKSVPVAGFSTVTNPGSAEAYPVFFVSGSGTLRWIENQTTGRRMYFDLQVLAGEEVVIDVGKGIISSSNGGTRFSTLSPGSDFRAFTLAPGENKLSCFVVDDVGAQVSIQFTPRYWSADATGSTETI